MIDLTEDQEQSFETIPAGNYMIRCTGAEVKDTKKGDGSYLQLELTLIEGEYEGRKVWGRFNLSNPNEEAAKIGRGQLKAFLVKSGWKDPNKVPDVNQLCGLECVAGVTIRKDSQYGDQNDVRYFKTKEESEAQGTTEFAPPEQTFE